MKNLLLLLALFIPILTSSQQMNSAEVVQQSDSLLIWLDYLSEKGLEIVDDSVVTGKEFQRVLKDENYRKVIFPDEYSWEQTIQFIQNQDLKKAFWFMINLYPENETNKELVVKSVMTYDKLFKMDELLVNTFYTYCFLDPQVSKTVDGRPEVFRPDILENKLADVKEIVNYIYYFREHSENTEETN